MKKLLLWGFGLWAAVFAVAFVLFPLRQAEPVFFETLISIALAGCTALATRFYFEDLKDGFFRAGIQAGVVWMLVNLAVDLILFLPESPMQMPFPAYVKDIGLTYLIIPIITLLAGHLLEKQHTKRNK
ncbi:MAG: hypothetical protein IPH12_14755 [Saprospirales bacterium]|jgi:hypothetical protein|nr:hypothetical protein [Saprospirales bacterium]MBK8924129.1 hypothetical protein [Saprospirales bacterium]